MDRAYLSRVRVKHAYKVSLSMMVPRKQTGHLSRVRVSAKHMYRASLVRRASAKHTNKTILLMMVLGKYTYGISVEYLNS